MDAFSVAWSVLKYGGRSPPIGVHMQMGRLQDAKDGYHGGLTTTKIPYIGQRTIPSTKYPVDVYSPNEYNALPVNQQKNLQQASPSKLVDYMQMPRTPDGSPQMNTATVHPPSAVMPTGYTTLPQVGNYNEDFNTYIGG